jgi:cytochrome c oxidase assembly factor CtaG
VRSLLPPTWHPVLYGVLAAVVLVYAVATRSERFRPTAALRTRFAVALVVLLAAYGWPLGDLASHVSLSALVVQRLLVLLCVAPLLMTSIPIDLAASLTRPAPIDRAVAVCSRPAVAVLLVTVIGTATLTPPVLSWSSSSTGAGALLGTVNLLIGVVLWLPVLSTAPGAHRLRHVGKGVYLLVSSLVVTSLSIVWIFARHPMYGSFSHQETILGISPIVDQQLAGFISKLGAYAPMWTIAFILLARDTGEEGDDTTLRWVDVQRELEREDRRARSTQAEPSV